VIREPYRDGRESSWTGVGFMRAFEGSEIEFDVNDVKTGMTYDIVIRYEPQVNEENGHFYGVISNKIFL